MSKPLLNQKFHKKYMLEALKEARKAYKKDEVPVGAVLVKNGTIIARGHNQPISKLDPTAHAEILALRKASKTLKNYRLYGIILYVTLEPCPMCAGALVHARIKEIVYDCPDVKSGACGSVTNIASNKKLNHRIKITSGILEKECRSLIQKFFKLKRTDGG